MIDFKDVIDDS